MLFKNLCFIGLLLLATTLSALEAKISYERKLQDERIEDDFSEGLRWTDQSLDKDETKIRVFNGYALLYGSVDNQQLKTKAEDHASKLKHVRTVFNQLQIGAKKPNWFNQTLLNGKIRSNFLTASDFDSSKVKFESFHTTVYLMGLVTSTEAEAAVRSVSQVSGVNKVVTLFEYVDTDAQP